MGVNMIGRCITDDESVCAAARQEIIRRYFKAHCDYKKGIGDMDTCKRIEFLMSSLGLRPSDRATVIPAVEKAKESGMEICTLGKRILRCETAPLCAISAVMYHIGEF